MGKGITGHELPYKGKTNEWHTPPHITNSLGEFDLDPCAGVNQNIAKKNFTIQDDGLSQQWEGRVWLNPPYGEKTKLWLEKMSQHMNGIVLIFARTETQMYHKFVWPYANSIFFFEGRIRFINESGKAIGHPGAPSCLISYDKPNEFTNLNSLKNCGLKGKFIDLKI